MIVPSNNLLMSIFSGKAITSSDIFSLIGIILLICCSAFFSSSETAYSSSNSLRLKTLAEEKRSGARKAIYITENFEKTLSCLLTFNNLVNISCTSIASYLFAKFIINPTLSNLLNTVILTIIILIFGEILPKAAAKANPEKTALKQASIVVFLLRYSFIYYPFYLLQKKITHKKVANTAPTVTENELESIIDTMEEEGVIDHDNKEILQGAISLGEQSAYDVMTHRKDAIFVEKTNSIEEIKKTFLDCQFSRIPVFEETRDNVIGVINQKDFFKALLTQNPTSLKLEQVMKPAHFVSEEMKLDDLIRELQREKKHMAIVVDEQGGTSGIVTLEDCIESMLGEIYDEHDEAVEVEQIVKQEDGTYVVDADTELTDLFNALEIEHLPETNYTTVGGLIFEKAEELCAVNDVVKVNTIDEQIDEHGNYLSKPITIIFTVLETESNKVTKAKVEVVYIIEDEIVEDDIPVEE